MFQWVADSSVFSDGDIIVVDGSWLVWEILNVFNDGTELDSIIDFRFFLSTEIDALSVATTFDVEDTLVCPDVFIITNQRSVWISTESGLSCS